MSNQLEFTLKEISKSYGELHVLDKLSLEIKAKRIVAFLGPSGCGKTTLLSIIAGLKSPDNGVILGLEHKTLSYLFQEPRLLDWLTVADNLGFVLKDKISGSELAWRIDYYLEHMEILAYRHAYPRKLSGGQRQRVAMARALAYPSHLLLMDEPFKSLDLGLKLELIRRFLLLWTMEPRTVLFVTHDPKEALLLADEIYILSEKPAVIKGYHQLSLPQKQRQLTDLALLQLEQKIIKELIEKS
ncbi:MAG TPA: ABC transporter ATP-binding protein [Firmicutes bacterium]|jgi:NitT/TauT family transport system ATP-binding protein|nr:ABC transporter ATP-binding protein [Bacillota bacterium]HBK67851.1 ABC transporter ATP-binding protein [Bacillota bacterium]HBT16950.1 ABC transporter ATP-binding protein [Bacillota bacterium]